MLKREYEAQAQIEVNQALALDPDIPEAHFLLGEIDIFRGRLDEAIRSYRRALEIAPDLSGAHYGLAFLYGSEGKMMGVAAKLESGRLHFKRALELGVEDERHLRDQYYSGP